MWPLAIRVFHAHKRHSSKSIRMTFTKNDKNNIFLYRSFVGRQSEKWFFVETTTTTAAAAKIRWKNQVNSQWIVGYAPTICACIARTRREWENLPQLLRDDNEIVCWYEIKLRCEFTDAVCCAHEIVETKLESDLYDESVADSSN